MADRLRQDHILEVTNLKKYFPIQKGIFRGVTGEVRAVDGISFTLDRGETMGLVGESGCGKTTASRCILRAIEPTGGQVLFRRKDGQVVDMATLTFRELKPIRSEMQMVFQDPYSSLNPRMTVLDLIAEPLKVQGWKRAKYEARVEEMMELVGLDRRYMRRYPHAFSGGQRQRIGIARALALEPSLVVADEPVSALDVSVQAQILNLLHDLKQQMDLTLLMVAHDLSVIRYISDKVAVMYMGRFVEMAETDSLFSVPKHPYTSSLLKAVPIPDPHKEWKYDEQGEVSDSIGEITGCSFAPRCPFAADICWETAPELIEVEPNHRVACHIYEELRLEGVS